MIEATLTTTISAPGNINGVAFSPDGHWLTIAADGKASPVVEVATGRERFALRHGRRLVRGAWGTAFSPDGRWLATSGYRDARIWDAATGQELLRIPHKFTDNPGSGHPRVQAVAFSPDSRWLATGSADCTGRIFDAPRGRRSGRTRPFLFPGNLLPRSQPARPSSLESGAATPFRRPSLRLVVPDLSV